MKYFFESRYRDLVRAGRRFGSAASGAMRWWFDGARQIGSQMRDGLALLGRALLALLLLPWTLLKSLGRALRGLSRTGEVVEQSVSSAKKSFRSSVIDLQESIESQPQAMKSRWRRLGSWLVGSFRARPAWQRYLLTSVAALGLLAVVSAYPAWHAFKQWRAENFMEEARLLLEEGQTVDAFFKGRAAYNLAPGNEEVLAELIRLGRAVRHPQTLAWGQRLLNRNPEAMPAETIASLAEEANDRRELALARAFLAKLEALEPEHPDLDFLRLQLALRSGNQERAFALARAAVRDGTGDRRVIEAYFGLGLRSDAAGVREATREHLLRVYQEESTVGLVAALQLLEPSFFEDSVEPRVLIEHVLDHPDVGRNERLGAYAAELYYELRPFEELHDQVRREFDLTDNAAKVEYARWLFRLEQYEALTAAFEPEEFQNDGELFQLAVQARLRSGREAQALEQLRGPEAVAIPELERLILEAVALRELGQPDAYASTVERAIARADETQFQEIEALVRQLGEARFLRGLYEKFASIPSTAAASNANLLLMAYRTDDFELLETVVGRSRMEAFSEIPIAQGLLAYMRGLRGEAVVENSRTAERLVAEYPSVIDFRVALAVNYQRAGFLDDAASLLQDAALASLRNLPGMYAVSLAILEAADASPEGLPVPPASDSILPPERDFVSSLQAVPAS